MWKGPEDPGGGPDPPPGSSQELSDLKDQFEQQQVLIAQLKEMIRKNEQSSVTQEKVDEYMNTLSKRGGRAKKVKKDDDNTRKTVDIPASQKINLLRQQVAENKLRLAERGKSQKGIEDMVTQLKAQLDDSQHLIGQSPLNLSLQDPKAEYSENSTAPELYVVLLTKEKRISDLLAKVHKLESNVLDLQENVKEKDSVIDARTKAITLMTENLSRKGKNTLDALDETKEQMRKMQENFVALEADMKARQMKLLDDLRLKNYEIAELQELNGSLERQVEELKDGEADALREENSRLSLTVQQHEVTIKALEAKTKESEETESEEVGKLKKQLEESNKNMIKVKAQNKAKVKELTKKVEAFKKMSDANAEIVKLEAENCRLGQKVAELEEEKGSLQLKLVESDSTKGSEPTEREVQDHTRNLEEKDKVISILEAEISRSKAELETLSEKLNAQVTSEMASIQFEEQMDSLENDKKKLIIEHENTVKEKEQLLETIEELKKEKQEMATKLEQYVQENMELIDKLEKLSAEKVSSAESIEIVESLTQQEKLELEAYQKSLDAVAGNMKTSEENLPQADLNESVNELTEETSELLQKIELFTVERREVMEKMEQLKQENLNLSLKIKEIENNRDVLAETYEQVQSEKELLDARVEAVEKENEALNEKLAVKEESGRVKELEEEIENNRRSFEEKRIEFENLNSLVRDLQIQLDERDRENNHLNNTIIDLNRTLVDLENDNKSLEIKNEQLEELKASLTQLIEKNQEEIEVISNKEWESRRLLESKDNEITKLMKERDNTESVILDLQKTIRDKDEKFHKISSDLKDKYLTLQKQLEDNSGSLRNITGPLEAKIEELTSKNKDQLEKMKKIAANLKKKNQAYQELEDKLKETQTRHEVELKTLLQQLQDLEVEVSRSRAQFEDKNEAVKILEGKNIELENAVVELKSSLQYLTSVEVEVSRWRQQFDDKCEELRVLEEKSVELQNVIADLRVKADKSHEVSLQQELLLTKENLGSVESSLRAKIQELEMIVETQEGELVQSRDRVNKLEEGISFMEDRRLSLERKANELGTELEEKAHTCEEMSRSEDLLERRLAALTAHDEAIERKLEEAVSENQELNQQNRELGEKNEKLKKKLEQMGEKVQELEAQQSLVEELETQNENLRKQIHNMENELRTLQNDYEKILEESKNDFDKVNGDWQKQFDEILQERTELLVTCEKFEEELKEITEKEVEFDNEMLEYKTKLEKSESEIKDYQERMQTLSKEFEEKKRKEVDELRKIIAEKEAEIESFNKQKANSLASFFDSPPREDTESIAKLQEEVASSRSKISELQKTIEELQSQKVTTTEAQVPQNPQKDIPTFVWSGQSADPFDFIQPTTTTTQEAAPQASENSRQELLDKIKTLEFMLFSMEKEKEDAIRQCHSLTNELTRLVYERETPRPTGLESQILQESDIRDTPDTRKELHQVEFQAVKPAVVGTLETGPVVEEVIQPKETYLCYADENDPTVLAMQSQILNDSDIVDSPDSRRELQKLEFAKANPPVSSADHPIKEEPCGAKDAYLCYTFGENDDGWGLGPDEARSEEEHAQKAETNETLQAKIRVLEIERENHLEEIKQLQIKSGKLIKKLKEFKAKNEQLAQRKKSESDLFNLDDTIQEELKLQIQQVEKRLKETVTELEKEKSEKTAILKRVDVLTAANERMVEMKEKQDVELMGWQRNYKDLSAKLERFEWGDDGFASTERPTHEKSTSEGNESLEVLNKKIEELNETINELTLDNEELQALLEEQRKLRIEAEKSTAIATDYSDVLRDRDALNDQLRVNGEEKKHLQDQINELIKKNTELGQKFETIEKQCGELTALITSKDEVIERLNAILSNTEREKMALGVELEEKNSQITTLKGSIDAQMVAEGEKQVLIRELEAKNSEITSLRTSLDTQTALEGEKGLLIQELQQKNAQIDSLRASLDAQIGIEKEKQVLFEELQGKNAQIDSLKDSVDAQIAALKTELDTQVQSVQALLDEKKLLTETISIKDTEIVRLSAAMEQMTLEWEMRIDQRGNDVAESWKLHVESRETEFAQIEQLLRKEINELEEKTNALVNENNELRKNVDAEIRNEVDRVAALQQQINDRQQYINDLTRTLQEKQGEIDNLQVDLQTTKKSLEEEKDIVDAVFKEVQEHFHSVIMERNKDSLVRAFREKENTIIALQRELQEIKLSLSTTQEERNRVLEEVQRLNEQLEERDQSLATLTSRLQEMQNLKDYENENTENLQQNLIEYQQINSNFAAQLQARNAQLEEKDREVGNLRLELEEKQREHTYALENLSQEYRVSINEQSQEIETLKRRLTENENRYEELLQSKDSDLEGAHLELKNHSEVMTQKDQELEELSSQLGGKIEECASLQQRIDEQTALMDEENKQLTELRAFIEEQVLKIEELKKELFEKSNDYDSLIAEMDISRSSVKESEASEATPRQRIEESDDLTEPVIRAELDLALYMLHQRDVRCEELTVELTQLLEERDTLQLRLSNVIREKEELGRRLKTEDDVQAASSGTGAVPRIKTEEGVEALNSLTNKLSELRTVGYRKDKTIVDEQELRRFQQLSIMQQHRDDASRLPPEAAARLVDASYTLSRDVQSPSKVLLNWLWGRSTPRVNDV